MTTAELLRQSVASLVVAAVFALIYFVAARAGHRFINRMALKGEPGARAATLWSVVRRLLMIVLVVTGLLTVASAVWELPLTPFIALGSAVGIAIGLGAQQLIQDVVAGFFLLLEDQYRIGDSVTLAGTSGDVEEIRLRVTVLRDVGGNLHYMPNGEIRLATNMTRDFGQVVLDVNSRLRNGRRSRHRDSGRGDGGHGFRCRMDRTPFWARRRFSESTACGRTGWW